MTLGLKVLLCLGEYEALNGALTAGWGGPLLDFLRHVQQHHQKIVLMFTGMKTFPALGREWTARFVAVRHTRVSFLTADECRPLLERPVPEFNLRYGEGALDALLGLTHGQPFLTQAVAYELVDQLNSERRQEASVADVEHAGDKAMESGEAYFHNLWDDAESDGQSLLGRLAQRQAALAGATRTRLREMDVLDDEGRFAVPLVEKWVRTRIA
ncbi:MAG: hypothetical protein HY736_14825 [Verrucomicrobia bacterium]|nr:hypothetical protein [Verrucomicrobiota bacterium]